MVYFPSASCARAVGSSSEAATATSALKAIMLAMLLPWTTGSDGGPGALGGHRDGEEAEADT